MMTNRRVLTKFWFYPILLNFYFISERTNSTIILTGFDKAINIILDDSHECVFSITEGVEQVLLGLYIIRGDNVALIGEIDQDLDRSIAFSRIHVNRLQVAKT
jgi:U6 snRNA-associated Sm-like protein LSm8